MRYLRLALLPLLLVACDQQPTALDLAEGPNLNASADHRAIKIVYEGDTYLFNAQGEIVVMQCKMSFDVFTQSGVNMVTTRAHCWTPNTSGRAAIFTPANNPYGPDLCAGGWDPDGNVYSLCDWREVISASGNVLFIASGTPIYE